MNDKEFKETHKKGFDIGVQHGWRLAVDAHLAVVAAAERVVDQWESTEEDISAEVQALAVGLINLKTTLEGN